MQSQMVQIAGTSIHFPTLLSTAKLVLARSISQRLDEQGIAVDSLAAFICCIDEMVNTKSHPIESMRRAVFASQHLFFSFMFVGDHNTLLMFMTHTRLSVARVETTEPGVDCAIISGTLDLWRDGISSLAGRPKIPDVVAVLIDLINQFAKHGIKEVFGYETFQASTRIITKEPSS